MRQMKTKLTEFGRRDFLRLSALGEGRLLVISPLSSRVPLVAPLCEALNAFAREIAARSPGRG